MTKTCVDLCFFGSWEAECETCVSNVRGGMYLQQKADEDSYDELLESVCCGLTFVSQQFQVLQDEAKG